MRSFNGGTPSAFTSLRFKDCSSKVIFGKILLIPVFHHRRLAEMFGKILLSLSSLLLIKTQNYYKKKPDNSQEVPGLFCRFSFYLYIEKNNTNRCCSLIPSIYPVPSKLHTKNHPFLSYHLAWLCPRPISNSQLHVLPHFHLCPIYLVVFKGSY